MPYIKFRNGITAIGRHAADWMQGENTPDNQTRRRGDVLVRRNGEFTDVIRQEVIKDGYYVLGDTAEGTRVLASPTALQPFRDRGPAPDNGGFILSELGFYGRGFGSMVKSEEGAFFADFDGDPAFVTPKTLSRTPNGRALTDLYDFNPAIPAEASATIFSILPGGVRLVGGVPKFFTGLFFTGLDGAGQYLQAFVYDDGENIMLGGTEYLPNQIGWFADRCVLAPGTLLKMDRYLRPADGATLVDVAACPGLRFSWSSDGGMDWSPVSSSAMFATELATITGLPTDAPNYAAFNQAIGAASLRTAPLSRTHSIAVAHVPYIETTAGPTYSVKVKVKLGLVDVSAGCTIAATLTLYDGTPEGAALFHGRDPLAVPGGVLVFTRPDAAGNEWNAPARVMFTDDGTDFVERSYMPLPEYKTGVPTGIDSRTLVCPMFDGAYTLYQSTDWGTTWTPRTTITESGVAPATGQLVMGNFSIVTLLRKDNRPANAAPATPWQYDCRVAEPG